MVRAAVAPGLLILGRSASPRRRDVGDPSGRRRANRELAADSASGNLLELARHVDAPVLMVQGADDPRPWTATDDLLRALPAARRVVLDRAGHAPWAERPDAVQAAVLAALSST